MIKRSKGESVFEIFNFIFLAVVSVAMIFPILHVAAQSFSDDVAISRGDVGLWPVEFTLQLCNRLERYFRMAFFYDQRIRDRRGNRDQPDRNGLAGLSAVAQ